MKQRTDKWNHAKNRDQDVYNKAQKQDVYTNKDNCSPEYKMLLPLRLIKEKLSSKMPQNLSKV